MGPARPMGRKERAAPRRADRSAGPSPGAGPGRSLRGGAAWRAGLMAEEAVLRAYADRGCTILARRWRSPWGEVDLILRDGATVVAVEVKCARQIAVAARRLSRRQMDRVCAALAAFCEGEPAGSLTPQRHDLALVDGSGRVTVLENAWGADWD